MFHLNLLLGYRNLNLFHDYIEHVIIFGLKQISLFSQRFILGKKEKGSGDEVEARISYSRSD